MAKITIADVKAATGITSGVGQMSQAQRAAAIAAASTPAPTPAPAQTVQPTVASVKSALGVSSGFGPNVVSQSEIQSIANSISSGTPITVSAVGSQAANQAIAQYNSKFFDQYKNMSDAELTQAATKLADDYNLAAYKGSGDHSKGFSVDQIKTYLQSGGTQGGAGLQRTIPRLNGLMDSYNTQGYLTADQINSGADTLKEVKNKPGLFAITYGDTGGSDKSYTVEYYTKDANGNFIPQGVSKTLDRTNPEGGLGALGGLIGAGLGFALGPAGFGLLGSNLAAGAVGGAVGGGLSSGNIKGALTGGLLGGLGGAFADAGGLGKIFGSGGDFNSALGKIQEAVSSGAMTQAEGMAAINHLNDLASGGAWNASQGLIDAGQLTGLTSADMSAGDWMDYMSAQGAAQNPFTPTKGGGLLQQIASSVGTSVDKISAVLGGGSTGSAALDSAIKTAGTAAGVIGSGGSVDWGKILGTGAGLLGGYLNTQASKDAAQAQADAQIQAAKIAADAAKFRPVGVTTRFGSSNFTFDPTTGYLKSAGYSLTPDVKAQQDTLMGMTSGLLDQYKGAQAATAPMGTAAARAMELGQGYLAKTPQEQAAQYMAEQKALYGAADERQLANLQNKLAQQGRLGLATGGTSTGMMAANPELEAFYNAQRQRDLQLAAQATQGGMDYARFGSGLVGTGGDLLKSMYGTQQAAYAPYQTAMGGAQYLEGLGQNALDLGVNMGKTATAANASAGQLLASGMTNAANTIGQNAQQTGSTWGNLLQGGGSALQNYLSPQQNPQQGLMMYNPYTGAKLI